MKPRTSRRCDRCDGTGADPFATGDPVPCDRCDGAGVMAVVEHHPARFGEGLYPVLAEALWEFRAGLIVDPFAGAGGIHRLAELDGFAQVNTVGIEIEPEWARSHPLNRLGNALALPFDDATVDAIATSPTYGNRFADGYLGEKCDTCNGRGDVAWTLDGDPRTAPDARLVECPDCDGTGLDPDQSERHGYAISLGRDLTPGSSAALQWGPEYRTLHRLAWAEAFRVIRPGGRLVVNVKDHQRDGRRELVTRWHLEELGRAGLRFEYFDQVDTGSMRHGANGDARYPEQVVVTRRPDGMF